MTKGYDDGLRAPLDECQGRGRSRGRGHCPDLLRVRPPVVAGLRGSATRCPPAVLVSSRAQGQPDADWCCRRTALVATSAALHSREPPRMFPRARGGSCMPPGMQGECGREAAPRGPRRGPSGLWMKGHRLLRSASSGEPPTSPFRGQGHLPEGTLWTKHHEVTARHDACRARLHSENHSHSRKVVHR